MGYSIFQDTMVDITWKEFESQAIPETIVLFPLGVIEEHGPHLPLGTDCYISYKTALSVKKFLEASGEKCVIAPPYYWGINHVTGAFPGSFTVQPETMTAMLCDLFHCLSKWGFQHVYCFNCHGDPVHIRTILNAIHSARDKDSLNIKFVMEEYTLPIYGLENSDEAILPINPEIDNTLMEELFASTGFDLHAGAYETATMKEYYNHLTKCDIAKTLQDTSLAADKLGIWNEGGDSVRSLLPLGYAGNPAGFETINNLDTIENIVNQCAASSIIQDIQDKYHSCN